MKSLTNRFTCRRERLRPNKIHRGGASELQRSQSPDISYPSLLKQIIKPPILIPAIN
jgi:hypothetical protein